MTDKQRFKKIGARFKSLRHEIGLTQEQVAQCLGVDQSYICKIEKGERLLNGEEVISKARQLFLCPVEELFEEEEQPIHKYCSISFRSSHITTEALVKLTKIQSIVESQFLMDYIEKNSLPALIVPEGADEFVFYMNLRNNFDPVKYKEQHRQANPPLPSCAFEKISHAMLAHTINVNTSSLLASQLRQYLEIPSSEPLDIFKVALAKIPNLTVVFADLDDTMRGVCYKGERSHVIVINQNLSLGRQRFALAHKLFHLYFDQSEKKEISSKYNQEEPLERIADAFASQLLLPTDALTKFLAEHHAYDEQTDKLQLALQLENMFQLSHQCAVSRLAEVMDVSDIPEQEADIMRCAQRYGFAPDLYQKPQHERTTNGYYLKQLNHLYKIQYIHAQKAHNFLELSQNFSQQELQNIKQHYDRYR